MPNAEQHEHDRVNKALAISLTRGKKNFKEKGGGAFSRIAVMVQNQGQRRLTTSIAEGDERCEGGENDWSADCGFPDLRRGSGTYHQVERSKKATSKEWKIEVCSEEK